ncbi:hypothetical protein L202_07139 [Cryptococcus amylolentus CBS 6039]|uniref:Major facilitator superfamily (MFS) profile domain-containing protein n=1 Tax=Cryptococcus amylolentus CBS 6039 TaxID=1295533 RepID=A0A1E3HEQ6_9TREE|nr:hypothetical protein L202_07139 [Cryptococcus amylolentus CBS 6039]ODN74829.1 hypothetical protein L202_07139 [Cryptococcus amylolentus CBS 6039]
MAEAIELSAIPTRLSHSKIDRPLGAASERGDSGEEPDYATSLPPVDRGRRAWLFLVAATSIEILIWGLPFAVGILHVYWTNTLFPDYGASTVTLAATLQTGLLYMSAALFGPIIAAYPRWQKAIQLFGLLAASISLISSAFVTKPWQLLVTFGCIYPLAGALYMPCATLLFEWFFERRGLASGIMYAGTGLGGTIFPYIIDSLLKGVGYKATMCSLGVAYAVLGSIALIFINRRVPISRHAHGGRERRRQGLDWSFMKSKVFFLGVATILLTSLGNFVPSLWLPSFADDLSLTSPSGTALISILNAASIPGTALLGYLSDHLSIRVVISISSIGSSLACALLWGWGTNTAVLVVFAIVFGLLGPSFSALWSGMISIIAKDDPVAPTMIFSIFAFFRGVGNITSGPISGALLKVNAMKGATGAYGFNNYGILLIYTAVTILGGAATGVMFKPRKS